jgi:cardiolipin synthase A/B
LGIIPGSTTVEYLSNLSAWLILVATVGFSVMLLLLVLVIIMDNRPPQVTLAWILLIVALPGLGILIYAFFGRRTRAFSRERKLARIEMSGSLHVNLRPLLAAQREYADQIREQKPASYRHRLLNLVVNNSSSFLTGYNRVEILQDALEKYPRLLEDIHNARHSIHLLYYIWAEDEFTTQLKEALIARAQTGVKVRALVDESSFSVSDQYLRDLREAGVQIYPYLAFKNLKMLHTANYRNHRKIVVVDGRIGYVGGMNLDSEQLPGGHPLGNWRDTHLRIEGEAALALQTSFVISWLNTTGEKITEHEYFPLTDPASFPFTPVQLTQSGPDSQWKAIRQLYFFMIMSAEKKCYIQSPFFIPDESLLEAIKAASLAGVDVRIMCTPSGGRYQLPYRAAHTYYADVVRAGAKVYLYDKGYLHSKTINIDGQVCAVGTANFDIRSFMLNYEIMAVIYDESIATELEKDFLNDLASCKLWNLAEYESLPTLQRLLDSIYRLASPLL